MATDHPLQDRPVNSIHDEVSENKLFEGNLPLDDDRCSRRVPPSTEGQESKLIKPDPVPYEQNRGRYRSYRASSFSSRGPEDRKRFEDHFRHRTDRESLRDEHPSSTNSGYPFESSYHHDNRCAGAEFKKYDQSNGLLASFASESNQRGEGSESSHNAGGRDSTNGDSSIHKEASNFTPSDSMYSHLGGKERRLKPGEDFGYSRDRRYRTNAFDKARRSESSLSGRERGIERDNYRGYRSMRDHSARGMDSSHFHDRQWERERNRDRGRWERDRDMSREYRRIRGHGRWDSERMYEKTREYDLRYNRFEPNNSYRPGDRSREHFERDFYRREVYGNFRREPVNRDTHEYYFHSRSSFTPERRSSSVESIRYQERYRSSDEGKSRDETAHCEARANADYSGFNSHSYSQHSIQERLQEGAKQYLREEDFNKSSQKRKSRYQDFDTSPSESIHSEGDDQSRLPHRKVLVRESSDQAVVTERNASPETAKLYPGLQQDSTCADKQTNLKSNSGEAESPVQADAQKPDESMELSSIDGYPSTNESSKMFQSQKFGAEASEERVNESSLKTNTTTSPLVESAADNLSQKQSSVDSISQYEKCVTEFSPRNDQKDVSGPSSQNDNTLPKTHNPDPNRSDATEHSPTDSVSISEPAHPENPNLDETKAKVEEQGESIIEESETAIEGVVALTQDEIFTMIDHIDAEIGRYEDLLTEVRKNKESCSLEIQSSMDFFNCQDEKAQSLKPDLKVQTSSSGSQIDAQFESNLSKGKPTAKDEGEGKPRKTLLYQQIYAENRSLAKLNGDPYPEHVYKRFEDYPFYLKNIEAHKNIRGLIFTHLRHKSNSLEKKEIRLKQEYKEHLENWRIRVVKLDKKREKKRGKRYTGDELLASNPNSVFARAQRRGGFYNADTVKSEAELLEIIQYLENEDLRNPDVRSMRTAAKIPSMILDPHKRDLAKYDNRNNLVEDPFNHYHCDGSTDEWTKEERDIFIKKYLQYPKQFGKIASFFKNKNPRQCVLFYYREKKSIDFKGLVSGQEKKKRQLARKGAGKKTGRRKKSKCSALLEDIDEAERLALASEEHADSQLFSDEKVSKDIAEVPTSPTPQKWRKKSRAKYRSKVLSDDEDESESKVTSQPPATTARWSEEDRRIALEAYKKFGQDFCSVSKAVGSKTDEQCRNFYYNFRRKYGVSALEAPLDMVTEKGADSKTPPLSNDSSQSERLGRKQALSVETNKAKRKQGKLKRKASEKILPEADYTMSPSIEDNSSCSGDILDSSHNLNKCDPSPSVESIKPETIGDDQMITSYSLVQSCQEKATIDPDIMNNPLNLIPLAISSSPLPPANTTSFSAPQENFLELLVQAAFSQEANASVNSGVDGPLVDPSFNYTKSSNFELSSSALVPDHKSESVIPMIPSTVAEVKGSHDVYDCMINQPNVGFSKSTSDSPSNSHRLPQDSTYYPSHTPKAIISESMTPFDTPVVHITEETLTHGVSAGASNIQSLQMDSQGMNVKPMNPANQPIKDTTDMLATLCAASQNDANANKDTWSNNNDSRSTLPIQEFSQNNSAGSLCPTTKINPSKRDSPLYRSCQDHNVINGFQMQHKITGQPASQPIQQLQLLQLQPFPTDIAQFSP